MVGLTAERIVQKVAKELDIPMLVEAAKEDPTAFGRVYIHLCSRSIDIFAASCYLKLHSL